MAATKTRINKKVEGFFMEWVSVESSNLDAVRYLVGQSILEMRFKDGAIYQYSEVPQYEYDELLNSSSKGKYANQNIYKRYPGQRIN